MGIRTTNQPPRVGKATPPSSPPRRPEARAGIYLALFVPLLLAARSTRAQTPTPTGTKDVTVAISYATSASRAASIALAGSADQSIHMIAWKLTDPDLVNVLCTAATGTSFNSTYTTTALNYDGSALYMTMAQPVLAASTATLVISMTGASGTIYGPISYFTTTNAGPPPFSYADTETITGTLAISTSDEDFDDQSTTLSNASGDGPLTVSVTATRAPVPVQVALALSGGTGNLQRQLASRLSTSGGTVWSCKFGKKISENFITADGQYTLKGNYTWTPNAVQVGKYLTAISGTTTATSAASTFATLTASGTIVHPPYGDGQPPKILFSPNGGCEATVCQLLDGATMSIFMTSYDFTSRPIADALQRAASRGIMPHIVQDAKAAAETGSLAPLNVTRGLNVFLDSTEPVMHDKYIVIDGHQVVTGSFNWTARAEHQNAENLVLIDDPAIAMTYVADWHYHAGHSAPTTPPSKPTALKPPTQTTCPGGKCPISSNSSRYTARPWRLRSYLSSRR